MRIVNTMRIGKNWEKGHGWSSLYIHRWQIHILLCKSPAPVTSKITYFCEIGGKIYYQLTLQPHVFFSTKANKKYVCAKIEWKCQQKYVVFVGLIQTFLLSNKTILSRSSRSPKVTCAGGFNNTMISSRSSPKSPAPVSSKTP